MHISNTKNLSQAGILNFFLFHCQINLFYQELIQSQQSGDLHLLKKLRTTLGMVWTPFDKYFLRNWTII